nr:hypothetical protein [Prochloraceae cyanobacterium]
MLEEQIEKKQEDNPDTTGWEETFHKNVLQELWEMVKIIKQEDKEEHRSELQSYCQKLLKMGQDRPFSPAWNQLLEISSLILANPKNVYRSSGKLVVKEIKQAADLVLAGQSNLIEVSDKLKKIAPESSHKIEAEELKSNSLEKNTEESDDRIDIEADLWSEAKEQEAFSNSTEEARSEQVIDNNKDAIEELNGLLDKEEVGNGSPNGTVEADLDDLLGTEKNSQKAADPASSLSEEPLEAVSLAELEISDLDSVDLENQNLAEESVELEAIGEEHQELESLLD